MRFLACVLAAGLALPGLAGCGLDGGGAGEASAGGDDASLPSSSDTGSPVNSVDGSADGAGDTGVAPNNDGGGGTDGGGVDASADGPAKADTGPGSEAGADGCATAEICNNGVDDNCDGKIDCADPQCGPGWKCVAAAPQGWSFVSYEMNGRDPCASGFGSPSDVVEGPSSSGPGCECGTCSVTSPGSCETGDFGVAIDGPAGSCSTAFAVSGAGGACTKLTFGFKTTTGSKLKVTPAPWQGGLCSQPGPSALPALSYVGQGETCALTGSPGAGCPNAGACAPTVPGGTNVCVAHTGSVACPTGFPHQHIVGPLSDQRSCAGCTCGVTAGCADPKETLFTAGDCSITGNNNISTAVTVDGQCDPVNDGMGNSYAAYTYTATVTGVACQTTGGGVTGTVTATGQTVCCP